MTDSTPPSSRRVVLLRGLIIALIGIAVIALACGFIVREAEGALVLRFGKPERVLSEPGWYARLPVPFEQIVRVDRRLHHADIRLSETLTRDQRNVIVPVYFSWRVTDPLRFHTAVRDAETARVKLDALVTSARNSVLGRHVFADLVAADGRGSRLPEIEGEMLALAANDAAAQFGVELVATGITQIQLPQANTESVFRRMRAERKREAEQFRAEGRAQATEMKAETDKEANLLIAGAKRQAEEIRGEAEARAAAIYATAHGRAPAFYRFLRELQSLRSVVDKNTTLVLDTSVAPFQWLKAGEGFDDPVPRLPEPGPSSAAAPSPSLIDQTP